MSTLGLISDYVSVQRSFKQDLDEFVANPGKLSQKRLVGSVASRIRAVKKLDVRYKKDVKEFKNNIDSMAKKNLFDGGKGIVNENPEVTTSAAIDGYSFSRDITMIHKLHETAVQALQNLESMFTKTERGDDKYYTIYGQLIIDNLFDLERAIGVVIDRFRNRPVYKKTVVGDMRGVYTPMIDDIAKANDVSDEIESNLAAGEYYEEKTGELWTTLVEMETGILESVDQIVGIYNDEVRIYNENKREEFEKANPNASMVARTAADLGVDENFLKEVNKASFAINAGWDIFWKLSVDETTPNYYVRGGFILKRIRELQKYRLDGLKRFAKLNKQTTAKKMKAVNDNKKRLALAETRRSKLKQRLFELGQSDA